MAYSSWQKMRQQLKLYLAPSLEGRVEYRVTSYRHAHDGLGHAEIIVDGKPVVNFCCYTPEYLCRCTFIQAADAYLNRPIKESLESIDDEIRKALAILDRRVGKRTLRSLASRMGKEPALVRLFCAFRCRAEGIPVNFEAPASLLVKRRDRKSLEAKESEERL